MKVRRPRRRPELGSYDPWAKVRRALLMLLVIEVVGIVGYRLLGLSWFDAVYQTAITITTVGFGEIGAAVEIDQAYRAFTLVLVFGGVSGALYTLGVGVEALVEGSVNDGLRLRRRQRMVDDMSGHMIIAGGGRVGRSIARYAVRHDMAMVLIERDDNGDHGDERAADPSWPVIEGDATDDAVLRRAGVARASTLIAALDSDASNVYVTLSARSLNPNLFIVARTNDQANEPKFFQAGADRVVNPLEIGGSRMGAVAVNPRVAEFIDQVLHDDSLDVEIAEMPIDDSLAGKTVGEILSVVADPPTALAVRCGQDQDYTALPERDRTLEAGDVLVVLGHRAEVRQLAG